MNVIISYLDTMFAGYPASPRLVEARAELQAMMEDAYAAAKADGMSENEAVGKVITEFGNLDELAPVLGITRELAPPVSSSPQATTTPAHPALPGSGPQTPLPGQPADGQTGPAYAQQHGDAQLPAQAASQPRPPREHAPLGLAETQAYTTLRETVDEKLGLGVSLLVFAMAPLIAVTTTAEALWSGGAYNVAVFVGIMATVALIACGVLVLVGRAQRLSQFARIERGHFSPQPDSIKFATDLAATHSQARTGKLQIAIGLWIFAFAPILAVTILPDGWSGVAVSGALTLVALGLLIFLPANWAASAADRITREGSITADGTPVDDEEHSIVGVIASFYWPLVTLGYLAWSFIGNAWGTSWIVWPIAGVLFGAIAAGFGSWESYRASKR
ncbi:permease prefix domain 1-containing protein [Leucobacter sp. NPDC015123]|uniref:permease prefix domain 1-containing protein n=1 Tax=Leucobacter sp. NPDC015123 TaxID=3364129 RepID=UPI0036F48639